MTDNKNIPEEEIQEDMKQEDMKKEVKEDPAEEANEEQPEVEEGAAKVSKEKDGKYKKENRRLTEALAEAEKALADAQDKYMRLAAEYDNFRRRSAKEKEGIYADAYGDCILAVLPVVDNLERALLFQEGDKVVEGVRMTMNQFTEALAKLGVEVIETKTFDPTYHNAVMHVEDEALGEGEIVEVFQKGYKKGDKVIRYAMVKVAN